MRKTRYAARALALSLSLTAVGTFGVVGAAATTNAGDPIGGAQLAASGVIVNLGPGVPAPPKMPGASFLIADLDTGEILVARAPHQRHLPASTLKTLTALTLIPVFDPDAKILVKAADTSVEGTHVGIVAGASYTAHTLFQGLLMNSGNDAAWALARANGSVAKTLKQMNVIADGLGAHDTVAKDPSGLDAPGETSSAYDLALIGRAAMKLPDFRGYVSTRSAKVANSKTSSGKKAQGFTINNHNHLIFNYRGAIGIKTGYTIAAKQTIIGAATRGGKSYIVSSMASDDGSWRPIAALLDWAFAHGSSITPVGTLVEPGAVTAPQPASVPGATPTSTTATPSPPAPNVGAEVAPNTQDRLTQLAPWVALGALILVLLLITGFSARRSYRKGREPARGPYEPRP